MLPRAPRRAVVLGGLDSWAGGLAAAGIAVVDAGRVADLVVAPPSLWREASSLGVATVLLDGRGSLPMPYRRYVCVPRRVAPRWVLDPKQRAATRWARSAMPARDRAASHRGPVVTVGALSPGRPYVLTAAGISDGEWCLALGAGGVRRRAVFYVFPPFAHEPDRVVKAGRLPGNAESFDRDERGLSAALAAGDVVARKAPRLLGRGEAGGTPYSVETALRGRQGGADPEAVVGWLREVGRATYRDGRVFRHGDVFPGNVVGSGRDFGLVDWEHADPAGLPLADLLFYAAHVVKDPAGDARLRRWVREAADDLGLSAETVAANAAETWRVHGERARAARLSREAATGQTVEPYLPEVVARSWPDDWRPW